MTVSFQQKIAFGLFVLLAAGLFFVSKINTAQSQTTQISATIKITICGDNFKDDDEDCDGTDLGNSTCNSQGFAGGGNLSCASGCVFDTSSCSSATPTPNGNGNSGGGGGGGGGGNNTLYYPTTNSIVFSGKAYPQSTITLLKDAQIAGATRAGEDAQFSLTISNLSAGNYIFSIYSEDHEGNRSSLLTFPISVTSNTTTKVSGIFIAPTIALDKTEVKKGDTLKIFGQSTPESEITINVNSEEELFVKTTSDEKGIYLYNLDTSLLEIGQHHTKSKTSLNDEISSFSKTLGFLVGTKNVLAEKKKKALKGDINNDGRVNLIDFSIEAYWYQRSNPLIKADLNLDGKVNLVDFSIMAFYWTG